MIELDYPRERMLGDIGAFAGLPALDDLSDPRVLKDFVERDQARLFLRIRAPHEILPCLDAALATRFPAVPPERLRRNLLRPIKKAVGNAHKRGNRFAPDKWITVEVIVTRAGAFVEVSDEGQGFDVATTYARFQAGGAYFAHKGSGFRRYDRAEAVVSFADGGSTFRARFHATEVVRIQRSAGDDCRRVARSGAGTITRDAKETRSVYSKAALLEHPRGSKKGVADEVRTRIPGHRP